MKKQGGAILFLILVFGFLAEAKPQPPGMSCPNRGYADGFCEDELNTPECGYDGGDCCNLNHDGWDAHCEDCQCHNADFECADYNEDWFHDGICDASLNNPECFFDGGDCCRQAQGWDEHCQDEPYKCQCLDPFHHDLSSTDLQPPPPPPPEGDIPGAFIAVVPIFCNDDEFERNGECVKRIKSQGNNKPFDLSIFGR